MKKMYLLNRGLLILMLLAFLGATSTAQNAWINEIHYDNAGGDVNEFIEVVIENPGNYNLAGFTVTLYNGNGGASYNSQTLDNYTAGNTVSGFTFFYFVYPANGIQNGAPDGMSLDYQGTVINAQFLSYEGVLTATDGPANGMTSTDIGVSEPGTTPIGESLQLAGSGTMYAAFTWQSPAPETPGAINNNQSFAGPSPEPSEYPTNFLATPESLKLLIEWDDSNGSQLPDGYLVLISDVDNITAPTDGNPVDDDMDLSDGEGALNVNYGVEAATFYRLMGETTYYLSIFPYTNAGINIDYKTGGAPPETTATTPFALNTQDFENEDFGLWTTISVASDKDWDVVSYGGAYNTTWFAQMNGYNQDELSNDWMISPSFNLYNYADETMEFHTQWRYGDTDDELMLKYSNDYAGGNPTAATWTEISFDKPINQSTWESSGLIDLSNIMGENVTFAFHYLATENPRRWGVDEIEITGTLAIPLLVVTSPELGENWEQGSTHDITWDSENMDYVTIEYTGNASGNDPNWEILATNVAADDESWTWNIPVDQPVSYDSKIRVGDGYSVDESPIFAIIEQVDVPELVISEIMYNPPEAGTDSLEFIEIYNNDNIIVDLDGYSLADGVNFFFSNVTIEPGAYVLVAKSSAAMMNTFQVDALQWNDGDALSNSGEAIKLLNEFGNIVDSVNYDDAAPWPVEPDGSGPSLRFCDFSLDNALGENWTYSMHVAAINAEGDTIFATPGAACVLAPIADFAADTTIVAIGGSVNFTDLSENNPASWSWTFEGGNPASSTEQNPEVVYEIEGIFDVSLTVTNEAGESTLLIEDYITVGSAPEGDFEASATVIDVGGIVDFTDLSTNDPDSWNWLFEGGSPDTSTMQNPTGIQYNETGMYDVTLSVSNMFGTFTLTKEDYIQVGPVGMIENAAAKTAVYPNPNNGSFTIEADPELIQKVEIFNILGEKLNSFELSGSKVDVQLNNAKGFYMIRFVGNDNSESFKRIIVQ